MGKKGKIKKKAEKLKEKGKNVIKKGSDKIKKLSDKVGDFVPDKIKEKAKKIGYKALLVYKPVMVAILKKRQHPVTMKTPIETVSKLFYDVVIMGKRTYNYLQYFATYVPTGVEIAAAAKIVSAIIDYFKRIKEKKNRGEKLTEDETMINEAVDNAENAKEVKEGFFKRILKALFPRSFNYSVNPVINQNRPIVTQLAFQNFGRRRIDNRMGKKNSIILKDMPFNNTVIAEPSGVYNPVNATEIFFANKSLGKQYPVNGLSAKETVDITPNVGNYRYKPNSWYQDKYGRWHWVDARGKIVT